MAGRVDDATIASAEPASSGDGGHARGLGGRRRRSPWHRGTHRDGRRADGLRRLLALIGWLAQVGEAPIADAAERFGMSEKELVAELELAACCGIPPYTPDTLMEIEVSEHAVRAFLPPEYARPRRLTPAEGFAVAASARLLLAVPGSDDGALQPRPGQARRRAGLARGRRPRRRRTGAPRGGARRRGRGPGRSRSTTSRAHVTS